jgi:hypothetical protein
MAPSIPWFAVTQDIKCEQNLTGLAPKGCFISAEAVESAVRQIGETQKAARELNGGIGAGFVGSADGVRYIFSFVRPPGRCWTRIDTA